MSLVTAEGGLEGPGLHAVLDHLAERDDALAAALGAVGYPPPRRYSADLAGLLSILVAQQVSAAAAEAIRNRLRAAVAPLTAARVLAAGDDRLRACGLSRRQVTCAQAIAAAVSAGECDLAGLAACDDAGARARLVALPGIGGWSAEVFLLLALRRADAFPAGDLALASAIQRLKGLIRRPDAAALTAIAEAWRPWRGAAALLLWHHRRSAP